MKKQLAIVLFMAAFLIVGAMAIYADYVSCTIFSPEQCLQQGSCVGRRLQTPPCTLICDPGNLEEWQLFCGEVFSPK